MNVPLPVYSVDEKRLAFSIDAEDRQAVPSFVKLITDDKGIRCIRLEGDDVAERGSY